MGKVTDNDLRTANIVNQLNKKKKELNTPIEFPIEFAHVFKVLTFGAKKYGANSWLQGKHFNHKDNHASMSRHLAEAYTGKDRDGESNLDPLLHLAARALMQYTLKVRSKNGN